MPWSYSSSDLGHIQMFFQVHNFVIFKCFFEVHTLVMFICFRVHILVLFKCLSLFLTVERIQNFTVQENRRDT